VPYSQKYTLLRTAFSAILPHWVTIQKVQMRLNHFVPIFFPGCLSSWSNRKWWHERTSREPLARKNVRLWSRLRAILDPGNNILIVILFLKKKIQVPAYCLRILWHRLLLYVPDPYQGCPTRTYLSMATTLFWSLGRRVFIGPKSAKLNSAKISSREYFFSKVD